MKVPWGVAPICLIVGILIGRIGREQRPAEVSPEVRLSASTRAMERGTADRMAHSVSAFATLRSEIRRAPARDMAALLKRALLHPDPLERRSLVLACFDGMDASNWLEMYHQFNEVKKESGMIHPTDQRMSLMVIGRRGGQEAAEWFRENAGSEQLREVIWGWAQQEPGSAISWLNQGMVEDPALRHRMLSVALGGAAHSEGAAAEVLLNKLPAEDRMACIGDFTWNLAQRDGMDSAVDWTTRTAERYGSSEPDYAAKVADNVTGHIFEISKDVGGAREAAMRVARIMESDDSGKDRMELFVSRLPASQPFEFLSEISGTPAAASPERQEQINRHLGGLVLNKRQAAADWLASNPDDPISPVLRELMR